MADYESKLIIKGEDKTSAAFKSAADSAAKLTKELEKQANASDGVLRALRVRARDTHQSYDDLLRNVIRTKQEIASANKAQEASANKASAANEKQRATVKAISEEVVGIASRYLSMGAAIDAARRSFVGFAESERKLLLIQNQTKATSAEIERSGEKIREVTRLTQTGFDETIAAANRLRNGLNIPFDEAIEKTTRLNVVAKGLGAVPESLAKLTSDMMRNMNIPAEQFNQTLEMIAATSRESSVEINDLIVNGGELAEVAKSIGYKGQDGMARFLTELGYATEIMGDTSKGARLLTQMLGDLSSAKVAGAFGIDPEQWRKQLEDVKKKNGDVAAFVINKLGTVRDKEAIYAKLGQRERLLFQKLLEENNGEVAKTIQNYKDLSEGQQAVNDGLNTMAGAQGGLDQLAATVKDLADQFGKLMVTLGVPDVIAAFTLELERLGRAAAYINKVIKWAQSGFKAELNPGAPTVHGLSVPNPFSVGEGVAKGFTGEGLAEERRQELIEKLRQQNQTPGVLPGLKRPGIPLPPGYKRSSYGGSADSAYLPANFQGGGYGGMVHQASYGGGGGSGGGGGGAPSSVYSPGGPQGYGGGTSYGGQTSVPTAGGSTAAAPSAQPGGGTVPQSAGGTASGDYQGQRVNQDVLQTRIQQANSEWMKDPKNQQKIFRTLQAEGGVGNIGANLEQMSNYAASRGKTLQQVVEARGRSQFYGPLRRFHGDPGSGPMMPHEREAYNSPWTPAKQKAWDEASKDVFSRGSNRINYATDQGTVGDPNYNPSKMTKFGGNMFGVQPGTERWVGAQRGKPQVDGPVTVGGETTVASGERVPRAGGGDSGGDSLFPRNPDGSLHRTEAGMNPELRSRLLQMKKDSPYGGANLMGPRSGYRSYEEQVAIYKTSRPGYAAKPGTSRHGYGAAGDLKYSSDAERQWYHANAAKYGIKYPMMSRRLYEPWHAEADPNYRGPAFAGRTPAAPAAVAAEEPKGEGAMQQREREEQVNVKMKVNDNDVQFARSSMRKQADREVREARWNSYSDIGAA